MRAIILVAALLTAPVQAEVLECPAQSQNKALLGAGMYEGALKNIELMGARKYKRGRVDVDYGFDGGEIKWLACWYSPETVLWMSIEPAVKSCNLRERKSKSGVVSVKTECK